MTTTARINPQGHRYYEYTSPKHTEFRWKKRRRTIFARKENGKQADDDQETEYFNSTTTTAATAATATATVTTTTKQPPLPLNGWERMQSDDGHPYYYHIEYGSVWKLPPGAILLETDTLPSGWIKTQNMFFNQFTGEWRNTLPDDNERDASSDDDDHHHRHHHRRNSSSDGSSMDGRSQGGSDSDDDEESGSRNDSSLSHPIETIRDTLWIAQRRASDAFMHTALPAVSDFGRNVVETLRKAIANTFFPDDQEVVNTFQGARTFAPLRRPNRRQQTAPRESGENEESAGSQHSSALRGLDRAAEAFEENL